MLTSDQSIVDFSDGRACPDRLNQKTHRHYTDYAEQMLSVYRKGIGARRRRLHRQIEVLFADEPDCPVRRIRAFCKLLDEKSRFQNDSDAKAAKLRLDIFSTVADLHPLVKQPDRLFEHSEQKIKAQLAAKLGITWDEIEENLYADVIAFQRLENFEGYPDGPALLSRYNVAQLQACLYRAQSMTVTAGGHFKTILRYAKLARLLHDVQRLGPSRYRIVFSGPASVLHQTRRYGVSFAKFLPALLACKDWKMNAVIQTPWKAAATLQLSHTDGFTSHLPPPDDFDSALEEALAAKFGEKRNGWNLIREGGILHHRQKTFIPDFTFRHEDKTEVLLEIVGFWTPEYLAQKRETLRRFNHNNILIALPEKSLRPDAKIGKNILLYKTALKLKPLIQALETIRSENMKIT